jgi:predicted nucleic-acid-binding Zn-ribbon protein
MNDLDRAQRRVAREIEEDLGIHGDQPMHCLKCGHDHLEYIEIEWVNRGQAFITSNGALYIENDYAHFAADPKDERSHLLCTNCGYVEWVDEHGAYTQFDWGP